jgi:hypothetical protein
MSWSRAPNIWLSFRDPKLLRREGSYIIGDRNRMWTRLVPLLQSLLPLELILSMRRTVDSKIHGNVQNYQMLWDYMESALRERESQACVHEIIAVTGGGGASL